MRNPLTPIRLAVAQLSRSAGARPREAIEVLVGGVGTAGAARPRVHRVRSAARGTGRAGGSRRAAQELARTTVPPHHDRCGWRSTRHRRRCSATTIRCGAPSATSSGTPWRRARGEGEMEIAAAPDERRGAGRRSAITDPASRPSSRGGSSIPTSRQERRHRAGPRAGEADDRDARGHHRGEPTRPAAGQPSWCGSAAR